jgi:hypothetical protein
MYRFIRSVTVKTAASMPAALQFSNEVTSHINKTYSMAMKGGVQMFGCATVYWFIDVESLDAMSQFNTKLMQDRAYWDILDKAKPLWLEGSGKDRVVNLLG